MNYIIATARDYILVNRFPKYFSRFVKLFKSILKDVLLSMLIHEWNRVHVIDHNMLIHQPDVLFKHNANLSLRLVELKHDL
ncbi:uncharacterized protein MELLADRAFT_56882 [Melampsora larici-populina 98AG31]|uniref:Uncharacterized protein n=1 Tax=Melampsora larici-populina (strain 98AG31 / pathotype 3-4-7) TaxID=747676 RepID=F4RVV2_MELLP|nr:uncharacterized protein MELLADRAFT_56882 [Melampsora larici-populina 98AG31]EGG03518.1 hypothetical protein MELLADRAFT_56882 [Melampsora larici-populina 98AG31]